MGAVDYSHARGLAFEPMRAATQARNENRALASLPPHGEQHSWATDFRNRAGTCAVVILYGALKQKHGLIRKAFWVFAVHFACEWLVMAYNGAGKTPQAHCKFDFATIYVCNIPRSLICDIRPIPLFFSVYMAHLAFSTVFYMSNLELSLPIAIMRSCLVHGVWMLVFIVLRQRARMQYQSYCDKLCQLQLPGEKSKKGQPEEASTTSSSGDTSKATSSKAATHPCASSRQSPQALNASSSHSTEPRTAPASPGWWSMASIKSKIKDGNMKQAVEDSGHAMRRRYQTYQPHCTRSRVEITLKGRVSPDTLPPGSIEALLDELNSTYRKQDGRMLTDVTIRAGCVVLDFNLLGQPDDPAVSAAISQDIAGAIREWAQQWGLDHAIDAIDVQLTSREHQTRLPPSPSAWAAGCSLGLHTPSLTMPPAPATPVPRSSQAAGIGQLVQKHPGSPSSQRCTPTGAVGAELSVRVSVPPGLRVGSVLGWVGHGDNPEEEEEEEEEVGVLQDQQQQQQQQHVNADGGGGEQQQGLAVRLMAAACGSFLPLRVLGVRGCGCDSALDVQVCVSLPHCLPTSDLGTPLTLQMYHKHSLLCSQSLPLLPPALTAVHHELQQLVHTAIATPSDLPRDAQVSGTGVGGVSAEGEQAEIMAAPVVTPAAAVQPKGFAAEASEVTNVNSESSAESTTIATVGEQSMASEAEICGECAELQVLPPDVANFVADLAEWMLFTSCARTPRGTVTPGEHASEDHGAAGTRGACEPTDGVDIMAGMGADLLCYSVGNGLVNLSELLLTSLMAPPFSLPFPALAISNAEDADGITSMPSPHQPLPQTATAAAGTPERTHRNTPAVVATVPPTPLQTATPAAASATQRPLGCAALASGSTAMLSRLLEWGHTHGGPGFAWYWGEGDDDDSTECADQTLEHSEAVHELAARCGLQSHPGCLQLPPPLPVLARVAGRQCGSALLEVLQHDAVEGVRLACAAQRAQHAEQGGSGLRHHTVHSKSDKTPTTDASSSSDVYQSDAKGTDRQRLRMGGTQGRAVTSSRWEAWREAARCSLCGFHPSSPAARLGASSEAAFRGWGASFTRTFVVAHLVLLAMGTYVGAMRSCMHSTLLDGALIGLIPGVFLGCGLLSLGKADAGLNRQKASIRAGKWGHFLLWMLMGLRVIPINYATHLLLATYTEAALPLFSSPVILEQVRPHAMLPERLMTGLMFGLLYSSAGICHPLLRTLVVNSLLWALEWALSVYILRSYLAHLAMPIPRPPHLLKPEG